MKGKIYKIVIPALLGVVLLMTMPIGESFISRNVAETTEEESTARNGSSATNPIENVNTAPRTTDPDIPQGTSPHQPVPGTTAGYDPYINPNLPTNYNPPPVSVETPTIGGEPQTAEQPAQPADAPPADKSPLNMQGEELLNYFNNAVNPMKTERPGYIKAKTTKTDGIKLSNTLADSAINLVKSLVLSEETEETPVQKGTSGDGVMSPDGRNYVSQLTMADLKPNGINVKEENGNYVITVNVIDIPDIPTQERIYVKIFEFLTVDAVLNEHAPKVANAQVERENIGLDYSDCYAKAEINKEGRVIYYETYVKAKMMLKDAKMKVAVIPINSDVDVVLISTTTYRDFIW
ncbi:MAG: hypothetical protein FWF08_05490 [Oscillospiraceae bacterium]|nr:hypothetical protein [Oscillospiraceae bacterium]